MENATEENDSEPQDDRVSDSSNCSACVSFVAETEVDGRQYGRCSHLLPLAHGGAGRPEWDDMPTIAADATGCQCFLPMSESLTDLISDTMDNLSVLDSRLRQQGFEPKGRLVLCWKKLSGYKKAIESRG